MIFMIRERLDELYADRDRILGNEDEHDEWNAGYYDGMLERLENEITFLEKLLKQIA